MALDLHLECPVTLKVRDRRRNPLKRQRRVTDEEERVAPATAQTSQEDQQSSRRSSHSNSPRLQLNARELTGANLTGKIFIQKENFYPLGFIACLNRWISVSIEPPIVHNRPLLPRFVNPKAQFECLRLYAPISL